jgi:cyclohexyl-isocyanide hydratase
MTDIDRRAATMLAVLAPLLASGVAHAQGSGAEPRAGSYMDKVPDSWKGNEKIGILLYDHVTAQDVIGPHYFLGRLAGAEIYFVADKVGPVFSENVRHLPEGSRLAARRWRDQGNARRDA